MKKEKKMYLCIRWVGIKFDFMNLNFKLHFVDSSLYFVQDKNNLNIRCYRYDPDPMKKVSDPAGQILTDPDPHTWQKPSALYISCY